MAPLLQKIHKSYLRILNGGSSPPSTPTAADAPTTVTPPQASLDILLAENDASSSIVEEVEGEEEFFYDADDVPGPVLLDPSMHVTPPSIIFDVDAASNDEKLGLAVPSSSSSQQDDITRISDARREREYESIKTVLAAGDAEDIVDALYNTPYLDGHISARLVSCNRYSRASRPVPVSTEPELEPSLPGGIPEVELLWELFGRTMKYGMAFLAYNIICGGYWGARFQADIVIQSVAGLPWFHRLYPAVESSLLGQYFAQGETLVLWDFVSEIKPSSGFIYWLSLQIALTLGDVQSLILSVVHHFSRESLQKYETAGFMLSDCDDEGSCNVADEATRILRTTGCIGEGHGENKTPPNCQLLVLLHISLTVEKLTNRTLLLLGVRNIDLGATIYADSNKKFKLPYTCLTLASTIVEIELRMIRNLPLYFGDFIEPFDGQLTPRQEAMMEKHRGHLDMRNKSENYVPELAASRQRIRRGFRKQVKKD